MILVTGGAGFIGSHIVRRLVSEGREVRVLDNLSSGRLANLADVAGAVDVMEADIRGADAVSAAVAGVETIYHQAAVPSVPLSVADPRTTMDVGVTGTLNVLLAARDHGVRRVVMASSSAVYGDDPVMPKREEMTPRPLSPYAVAKLAAEHLGTTFWRLYGLETVSLRYFNVYGPDQDPDSPYAAVIPAFLAAVARGKPPVIFGDGEQTRDFCHVGNVVDANLLAAEAGAAAGQVYNIADGQVRSLNDVLGLIASLLGATVEARREPERSGDIRHSAADISRARHELGYEPRVSFEEGIRALLRDQRHIIEV